MVVDYRKEPSRKSANVIVLAYSDSLPPQQTDACDYHRSGPAEIDHRRLTLPNRHGISVRRFRACYG